MPAARPHATWSHKAFGLALVFAIGAAILGATGAHSANDVWGNTDVGAGRHYAAPNYRLASRFTLEHDLTLVRMSAFVLGRGTTGSQAVRAVIYSDSGGNPATIVTRSVEVNVPFDAAAGWIDFTLPQPVTISPGDYWLGLHSGPSTGDALILYAFTGSAGAQRTKSDLYSDGTATSFGSGNVQDRSMSIYAVGAGASAPVNTSPPSITGSPLEGESLSASTGEWSGTAPITFSYQWLRCGDSECVAVADDGPTYVLGAADVGSRLEVEVTAANVAGQVSARSGATATVVQSIHDGLSQIADAETGSSDPTYYASNRRLAITRAGRLLAVHGKHATGVQLAWRDPAGAWQTVSRGEVSNGLLLSGTGTGDWPASIAVAEDSSGREAAWVVWSRAAFGSNRPVQLRRLSDLDAPAGPIVGPIVTVDVPPLGAARADLAFERLPDGSSRGCIVWTRRVSDSQSEVVAAWFTDLASDAPALHDVSVVVPAGTGGRTATLVPSPAGLRLATPAGSSRMQIFGHDIDAPLTEWWSGAQGVPTGSSSRPSAVATVSGDVLVAVEANTVSNVTVVQRFTRSSVANEITLSGYSMPSIATDGLSAWLVAIRRSDGFVVSRLFAPSVGWSGSDRVEIGDEGGGGYAWPNLLRQVDGRLRLIVQGPAGSSSHSAVLAYQRVV
jgi:hypothetical protein